MTDTLEDQKIEDVLAHFGVKGMRWGHRKPDEAGSEDGSSGSKGLSDGQKKALKYAAGGALVAGALITAAVLAKNGKLPVSSLRAPKPSAEAIAKTKELYPTNGELRIREAAKNAASRAATREMYPTMGTVNARANLDAELTRRAAIARAETVARGERIAERLGTTPEKYWQQQVKNFNNSNNARR